MLRHLGKRIGLAAVGRGFRTPEMELARIHEFVHLKDLLDRLQINCIVDVGANVGQSIEVFRGLGYGGLIVSFEPLSRAFDRMERAHGLDPNWKGFQLAVGDQAGSLDLHVNPDTTTMSSVLQPRYPSSKMEIERVEVVTLDSVFDSLLADLNQPRVLLKIDTEGYDLRVFEGAKQSIPKILAIQVEIFTRSPYLETPGFTESLQAYQNAGYEPVQLSVVSRTPEGAIECMNCLMRQARSGSGSPA